jgi:membrane-bound ClpP family serine protease
MDPIFLILILVGAGIVLLVGELLLPTHGGLGIAGVLSLLGAVGVCFYLNQWLGLGVLVAGILISPFVWNFMIAAWLKTPVGKRIVLTPFESKVSPPPVQPGDIGVTVSELRPMGEVEFGQMRIEAISELGMIPPGSTVRVVAIREGMPAVRVFSQNQDKE